MSTAQPWLPFSLEEGGKEKHPGGALGCPGIYGVTPTRFAQHGVGGGANPGTTLQPGASVEAMRAGLQPKRVMLFQKSS